MTLAIALSVAAVAITILTEVRARQFDKRRRLRDENRDRSS